LKNIKGNLFYDASIPNNELIWEVWLCRCKMLLSLLG
jgi:hypothetical protein